MFGKRFRTPSPDGRRAKSPRYDHASKENRNQSQWRRNQSRTDAEAREWVNKEDEFVLRQARKKAQIRVREGRAKPIDYLAVLLATIDPDKAVLEDDSPEAEAELTDPIFLVEELSWTDLEDLDKDLDTYLALERQGEKRRFWKAIKSICKDRKLRLTSKSSSDRGVSSISEEISRLLSPKSRHELDLLEDQVKRKLRSNEDIDIEYWERLLDNVHLYKARADLKSIFKDLLDGRLTKMTDDQIAEAERLQSTLADVSKTTYNNSSNNNNNNSEPYMARSGPHPELKIDPSDRKHSLIAETQLLESLERDRRRVLGKGYIPSQSTDGEVAEMHTTTQSQIVGGDGSQSTSAMYAREAARGFEADEEAFAAEENIQGASKKKWQGNFRARKPKHFNRVQMGYEWNKYNQTHYDQDNPPPKMVQGYKFNIFYPDLIDKTKAPTYRIERENGRKRGQSFAPAGEEDTCIIRFMSGPPYEDVAFRIVDKEWDYSARRERGFRSTFDKGILQLHFQFKRVHYRK